MKKCFGLIGGDRRQVELAALLKEDGHEVRTYGLRRWEEEMETSLERTAEAEFVILPMPLLRGDGLLNCQMEDLRTEEVFSLFREDQWIFAGSVRPEQRKQAERLKLWDYLDREELAVANAIPTAEGALGIAMEQLPAALCGTEVLVLGYGRIGKLLAHRLWGLGACVTVAARKYEDRVWAKAFGCRTLRLDQLTENLNRFLVVFNTVPALLLQKEQLQELRTDCLYIDVASQPGLDQKAADDLGLQTIWARGLPGKVAPVTAAVAIRDAVYHILEERGGLT